LTRRLAAAASLGLVLAGAGCGTQTLDVSQAEKTIAAKLTSARHTTYEVKCPDEVKIKRGDTFNCRATSSKQNATVRVTQLDDKGKVRWVVIRR
jgi:hypothetical protein